MVVNCDVISLIFFLIENCDDSTASSIGRVVLRHLSRGCFLRNDYFCSTNLRAKNMAILNLKIYFCFSFKSYQVQMLNPFSFLSNKKKKIINKYLSLMRWTSNNNLAHFVKVVSED